MKNNVAELRLNLGLSQAALANEVGTSRQTIISLEKGRYQPGVALAIKIARTLNTGVEQLFVLDD